MTCLMILAIDRNTKTITFSISPALAEQVIGVNHSCRLLPHWEMLPYGSGPIPDGPSAIIAVTVVEGFLIDAHGFE